MFIYICSKLNVKIISTILNAVKPYLYTRCIIIHLVNVNRVLAGPYVVRYMLPPTGQQHMEDYLKFLAGHFSGEVRVVTHYLGKYCRPKKNALASKYTTAN